jgi:hypothetical protein
MVFAFMPLRRAEDPQHGEDEAQDGADEEALALRSADELVACAADESVAQGGNKDQDECCSKVLHIAPQPTVSGLSMSPLRIHPNSDY